MRTLTILLTAVAITGCAEPEKPAPPPSRVVEWMASVESARPTDDGGSLLDVALVASVDEGWKVYSLSQKGGGPVAMTVRLDSASAYRLAGPVVGPKADYALDPNFGIETETYAGKAVFRVPVRAPAVLDPRVPIELKGRSQACSDRLCLPAKTTTITVNPPVT